MSRSEGLGWVRVSVTDVEGAGGWEGMKWWRFVYLVGPGGEFAGAATAAVVAGASRMFLCSLSVEEEYRRRGVATAIVDAAKSSAKRIGLDGIFFTVARRKAAQEFWGGRGARVLSYDFNNELELLWFED